MGLFKAYKIETRNLNKAMGLGFGDSSKMYPYRKMPCVKANSSFNQDAKNRRAGQFKC